MSSTWSTWGFVLVGLGFSFFYGIKAAEIFQVQPVDKISWRLHQFWLNFLGSVVGWITLWFVMERVVAALSNTRSLQFNFPTVLLFLLAFVGIIGFLPVTVVNLINSVGALVGKIAGLPEPRAKPSPRDTGPAGPEGQKGVA